MGYGLHIDQGIIKPLYIEAACKRYAALVRGSGDNKVALPAGANDANLIGFSLYDVDAAGVYPVIMGNGIVWGRAASAFNAQALLRIADNQGRLEAAPSPRFKQFAATAVAANAKALGFSADALLSVFVTAGGVTGKFNVVPAGRAPALTKDVSLSADRATVNFLAGDAVTAADIDVLLPPQNIVAVALAAAANANDEVPCLIVRMAA